jgi:hypothetical protein
MTNYCQKCGSSMIGMAKCPECKWSPEGESKSPVTSGYPCKDVLKQSLVARIARNDNPVTHMMPADQEQAAEWWLQVSGPEGQAERPRKSGGGWYWPYGERVKYCLFWFLSKDVGFQELIVCASQDGIYWRGDERWLFERIIRECQKLEDGQIQGAFEGDFKKALLDSVKQR